MAGNNNNKNNEYVHTCRTVIINCHTKVLESTRVKGRGKGKIPKLTRPEYQGKNYRGEAVCTSITQYSHILFNFTSLKLFLNKAYAKKKYIFLSKEFYNTKPCKF